MAECLQCNQYYLALDEDAGTYKENFCSEECEQEWEKEIDGLQDKDDSDYYAWQDDPGLW